MAESGVSVNDTEGVFFFIQNFRIFLAPFFPFYIIIIIIPSFRRRISYIVLFLFFSFRFFVFTPPTAATGSEFQTTRTLRGGDTLETTTV